LNRSDPAARCYAEALLLIGKKGKRLGAILEDLRAVAGVFQAERRLWDLWTSPRIDRKVKEDFIRRAYTNKIGTEVLGLLVVMVHKGREALFDNVVAQFEAFRDQEQNRIHVRVSSARGVDADVKSAIEKAVAEASGKSVVLHERTDPSLIAGLVVRVGDIVVDGSLRSRLKEIGARLASDRI
jgi:F-type H+-transporting ATPase subunit delta